MVDEEGMQIGGEDVEVEVDESMFKHRKYWRGRRVGNGKWVVGGINKYIQPDETRRPYFVAIVDKRDADTMKKLFKKYVKPGSKVSTDEWKAYKWIGEKGSGYNEHNTVCHKRTFKAKDGTCTNTIEGNWHGMKCRMPKSARAKDLDNHLFFVVWRDQNEDDLEGGIINALRSIVLTNNGARDFDEDDEEDFDEEEEEEEEETDVAVGATELDLCTEEALLAELEESKKKVMALEEQKMKIEEELKKAQINTAALEEQLLLINASTEAQTSVQMADESPEDAGAGDIMNAVILAARANPSGPAYKNAEAAALSFGFAQAYIDAKIMEDKELSKAVLTEDRSVAYNTPTKESPLEPLVLPTQHSSSSEEDECDDTLEEVVLKTSHAEGSRDDDDDDDADDDLSCTSYEYGQRRMKEVEDMNVGDEITYWDPVGTAGKPSDKRVAFVDQIILPPLPEDDASFDSVNQYDDEHIYLKLSNRDILPSDHYVSRTKISDGEGGLKENPRPWPREIRQYNLVESCLVQPGTRMRNEADEFIGILQHNLRDVDQFGPMDALNDVVTSRRPGRPGRPGGLRQQPTPKRDDMYVYT
jgi:hypothetical protein